jgi:hypothetical protein
MTNEKLDAEKVKELRYSGRERQSKNNEKRNRRVRKLAKSKSVIGTSCFAIAAEESQCLLLVLAFVFLVSAPCFYIENRI